MARQTTRRIVAIARKLRREMTLPEVLLWRELRQSDLKFRKQHPVGRYVLDFYCAAAKLGIEVDGIAHDMGDHPETDVARDASLRERGLEIVRIRAADVLKSVADVAAAIEALCRERSAKPLHHRTASGGPPPHPAAPDRED